MLRVCRALEDAQTDMKDTYDVKSVIRHFKPGDQVLLLLPMQGDPMRVTLSGPYIVNEEVDDLNYSISTPWS